MKIICKSKNHSNQEYRQEGSSITFVPFLDEENAGEGVISVFPLARGLTSFAQQH